MKYKSPLLVIVLLCLVGVVAIRARIAVDAAANAIPQNPTDKSVNVLTNRYDNFRTGANLNETVLNTANVNAHQFGKLFSHNVNGYVYAQPLYVAHLPFADQTLHNVVYVATEQNEVYAFDADDASATGPLWQVNLGLPVPSTDIDENYRDLTPAIGITSTPVIDLPSQTIFLVAKSKDSGNNRVQQRLHALDLTTGQEKPGSPVEIAASVPGTGAGSENGVVKFDPLLQLNRPGLLLLNGVIYLAFGSHGGARPYHGWVLGYDAKTLQQVAVFNTTPDGGEGAVWQSGVGLAADAEGYIYLVTGNGTFNAQNGGRSYGDSALKLGTSNGLSIVDFYTPHNEAILNELDADLGSGGPLLLPGFNRLIFAGKDTVLRVLDTKNLGRFDTLTDKIVQRFQISPRYLYGAPVFWNSPHQGPIIYYWAAGDTLKVLKLINGKFQEWPVTQSTVGSVTGVSNAPPITLSANGNKPGTGLLWATAPTAGDANQATVPGILRALDATDVTRELWNSKLNADTNDIGNFAKFCPPTVANGKVYVATFSGKLHVFGLLPGICNFKLDQSTQFLTSAEENGTVNLSTEENCNWLASSNESWINILSGAEGTGSGSIYYTVEPNPSGLMRTGTITVAGQSFAVTQAGAAAIASAASFDTVQLARESIAALSSTNLATETASASGALPTTLGGVTVQVTDMRNVTRLAPLFFVSPEQINLQIPPGTPQGAALLTITNASGNIATATTMIEHLAPGLFSANANGQGVAAAVVLRVKADGTQSFEPASQYNAAQKQFVARPIDLSRQLNNLGERVFLILFGTGLRFRSDQAQVKVTIGNVSVPVLFAGAQGGFVGLDQINLELPQTLAGKGEVDINLTAEGKKANAVKISIK